MRRTLAAHKIVLEFQSSFVGINNRSHRLISHRRNAMTNAEFIAEKSRYLRELLAARQSSRAFDVSGEVSVAELEPDKTAELLERRHEIPAFISEPPAARTVINSSEPIHHRVEVRGDTQPEVHEVVAGVDDDQQSLRLQL